MSTVHKHFPITSHPGSSWGQGPQVGFHVSDPLWGKEERDGGGFENKQFEWKISTSSHVQTLDYCSEDVQLASLCHVWWWRWLQAARHHRSTSASVISHTMDGGSSASHCGSRCQVFQAWLLITPSGCDRSQSRESPHGSMATSTGSPVWLAIRHVAAGVLPPDVLVSQIMETHY